MANTFQHRHYKAIAEIIRQQRDDINAGMFGDDVDPIVKANDKLIADFKRLFRSDNDRFSAERFEDAARGDPRMHGKDKVR